LVAALFTPNFMSGSFLGGVAACSELEFWLLLPLPRWKRLWPRPALPEPLGAWSRPMVLSCLGAKLACLFHIVEPIATAGLGDPTGTPTGSGALGATEGLGAWIGCTGT